MKAGGGDHESQPVRRDTARDGLSPRRGNGPQASGQHEGHREDHSRGDDRQHRELVRLPLRLVRAHVPDTAELRGEDVPGDEGEVRSHCRGEAEGCEGELRGRREGDADEDGREGGVDHGVEDLAEDERRGDGVHRRLQGLHHVSERHGHRSQRRHSQRLACGEGHPNGDQLQQVIPRKLRDTHEAGEPHERSHGDAGGELHPRNGP
mmetsp:Transcript_321/g.905  ORF Transcript_321/g.905 Transcript_321/m.905 type:complete len:207 (+) Transcript_321:337-957(+)